MRAFILKRVPIIIFLLFYFFFTFATYKQYGLTLDEFFVYTRGKYFYTKVRGNDAKLQKGFVVNEGKNGDLLYNNSSYPAFLYVFNDDESFEGYHLVNMLVASVFFLAIYELLLHLYRKPYLALLGPVVLFFTPRFLGDIPANPKDTPFAVFYFLSLIAIFLTRKKDEKLKILAVSLFIGLTASIRFVGFTLLFVYFIFDLIQNFQKKHFLSKLINTSLMTLIIFFIAFLIFIVNMPYVAADPFNHLLELLNINKSYPWYGEIFYFGNYIPIEQRSHWYLFFWILFTTPVYLILFFFLSLRYKFEEEKRVLIQIVFISLILQILFYLLLKPVIYNGLRHYLFLVIHIVFVAIVTIIELLKNKKWKKIILGVCFINLAFLTYSYIKLHPYEYTFFNVLIGWQKGAYGQFEIDYWGASDKEALEWLKNKNGKKSVRIYICSKSEALKYYYPEAIDANHNIYKADFIVCYDPILMKTLAKKIPGKIIHEVKRASIPYNIVYQVEK